MTAHDERSRRLPLLLTGYVVGLAIMIAGVLILDSRWVVGIALALLAAVSAVGYHWLRCSVCRHSILHYNLRELRSWWRLPDFCPFCAAALADTEPEPAPSASSAPSI